MRELPKRGATTPSASQKVTTAHKFEGYKGGHCGKCDLRDTHPVHHKDDLNELGWPRSRKPDKLSPTATRMPVVAPEKDK